MTIRVKDSTKQDRKFINAIRHMLGLDDLYVTAATPRKLEDRDTLAFWRESYPG